jgi:hypothetical protein
MLEEALLLVNRARHTWEEHLLRSHNVVGVGIGLKETGGVRTTDPAVVIYVSTKLPPARLSARDVLPPTLSVKLDTGAPGEVATDVVETGHIRALSGPRDRSRPALGGCSVGHHACGCAGTLGGLVTDSKGRTLILSNNHVMAMLNDAKRGDRILQPGPFDGGVVSDDTLGRVDRYVTIRWGGKDANFVDACTAKPSDGNIVAAGFLGIGDGRPTLASAVLDMKVRKSGRTTGVTTGGEITDIDATFTVGYGSKGSALFKNQTVIRSSKRFSDHGDSGSFILMEEEPLRAVGLLFAGNSPGTVTLANHMRTVLEELEVRLPEGGNDAA